MLELALKLPPVTPLTLCNLFPQLSQHFLHFLHVSIPEYSLLPVQSNEFVVDLPVALALPSN